MAEDDTDEDEGDDRRLAAIVGGVAGFCILALLVALVLTWRRRRRHRGDSRSINRVIRAKEDSSQYGSRHSQYDCGGKGGSWDGAPQEGRSVTVPVGSEGSSSDGVRGVDGGLGAFRLAASRLRPQSPQDMVITNSSGTENGLFTLDAVSDTQSDGSRHMLVRSSVDRAPS